MRKSPQDHSPSKRLAGARTRSHHQRAPLKDHLDLKSAPSLHQGKTPCGKTLKKKKTPMTNIRKRYPYHTVIPVGEKIQPPRRIGGDLPPPRKKREWRVWREKESPGLIEKRSKMTYYQKPMYLCPLDCTGPIPETKDKSRLCAPVKIETENRS